MRALSRELGDQMDAMYRSGINTPAIGERLGVSVSGVIKILKRRDVVMRPCSQRKYIVNDNVFDEINTEAAAYWLGFVYADGCVHPERNVLTMNLSVKDKDHTEKFVSWAGGVCRELHSPSMHAGVARAEIRSALMLKSLQSHGVTPRKSGNIRMPALDGKLVRHFIRGYFDGDGCIFVARKALHHDRYGMNIVSNNEFLEDLQIALEVETGVCHGRTSPLGTSGKVRTLWFTVQKEIHTLLAYMYLGATVALERKATMARLILAAGCRDHRRAHAESV